MKKRNMFGAALSRPSFFRSGFPSSVWPTAPLTPQQIAAARGARPAPSAQVGTTTYVPAGLFPQHAGKVFSPAQLTAISDMVYAGYDQSSAQSAVALLSDGQADYLARFIMNSGSQLPPQNSGGIRGLPNQPNVNDVFAGLIAVKQSQGPLDTSWAIRQNFDATKAKIFADYVTLIWGTNQSAYNQGIPVPSGVYAPKDLGHWPPTPQDELNGAIQINASFF